MTSAGAAAYARVSVADLVATSASQAWQLRNCQHDKMGGNRPEGTTSSAKAGMARNGSLSCPDSGPSFRKPLPTTAGTDHSAQ